MDHGNLHVQLQSDNKDLLSKYLIVTIKIEMLRMQPKKKLGWVLPVNSAFCIEYRPLRTVYLIVIK